VTHNVQPWTHLERFNERLRDFAHYSRHGGKRLSTAPVYIQKGLPRTSDQLRALRSSTRVKPMHHESPL